MPASSNCSASLSIPVFMISEFSPIKHQPAASKRQRSSPITVDEFCRSFSVAGCFGAAPTAVGLSPTS